VSFRIEQKLTVSARQLHEIYRWLASLDAQRLFPPRVVISTYFDNLRCQMFHDSEEGSLPRKKIRIRCYNDCDHADPGRHKLEVKVNAVEGRFKTVDDVPDLRRVLRLGITDSTYGVCHPILTVRYVREYFSTNGVRLTVDRDLTYHAGSAGRPRGAAVDDPGIAVEIKASHSASIDDLVNLFPVPRIRFSKYSRAALALSNAGLIDLRY
jgi:hypothetical protein